MNVNLRSLQSSVSIVIPETMDLISGVFCYQM